MHDLTALLDHRHLVLTNRNSGSLKCSNVGCLADRVAEEAHRNACLEVTHLDLRLYGWVSLKAGNRNQIHVIKAELSQLRNHGLDEDGGLLRVKAAGKVIQRNLDDIVTYLFWMFCVVS